jgi:hypothetical protein
MENEKVRKKFRKTLITALLLSVPTFGAIALWIIKGIWIPFAVWFPIQIVLSVFVAKLSYKDTAFICAECNAVFKPPFKSVILTSGTTKARWLTCTKCGHSGYCVETVIDGQ